MRSAAVKQHPDSVNRDLDDEGADAIEHQYARKLMKKAAPQNGAGKSTHDRDDEQEPGAGIAQLRDKSGR